MATTPTHETRLDPVTFEVLKNGFSTIVDEMAEQILRTCHSFVLYCRDFSSALCDRHGNTIAQGKQDLAAHVGTLHFTAQAVIEAFGSEMHPGDVFLINDPFRGGTHFPDVRVVRPIFVDDELIAFAQSNGHWSDVGGAVPGSENFKARDYFADGFRIPPVRVWDRGTYRDDVVRLIVSNMRAPSDAEGDLRAQTEATRVAERELLRMIEKYGLDTVLTAFEETQSYVERFVRARIAQLPDGSWQTEDYLDYDPAGGEGLVPVRLKMTIDGDRIHYDLTGSHPVVASNQNAGFGGSFSGVVGGMKMFFPDVPLNSGFYRPITVELPPGTVVNADPPAAVSGFVMPYEKIMNSVIELWSELIPERAMACSFNIEYLEVGGWDTRADSDEFFMWYDWMVGGWGGRHDRDGASPYSAIFGAGLATQPIEGQERLSPVLMTRHELLADSGGPGRFRGGLGVIKGGRLTDATRTVMSYLCDRERAITWGIQGGLPSNPHGVTVEKDGEREFLGAQFADVEIESGTTFERPSAGGGGLGDPLDRNPEAVREDVIDGYVTVERALRDYGVVLHPLGQDEDVYELDLPATEDARAHIRAHRRAWLDEDAQQIADRYTAGELTVLDVIRQYGVILDWQTGAVHPKTTETFRAMMRKRAAASWVSNDAAGGSNTNHRGTSGGTD
jgi:N-methylhydantoinase B